VELLLAAAMVLAEIERQDRFAASGRAAAVTAVAGGAP
jgi:hypothetical protein